MSGAGAARLDAAIAAILAEIGGAAWFAACGEPVTPGERADAVRLAAAAGIAGTPIALAADWREAARVTQRGDWSREWWQREAAAEAELKARALGLADEAALLAGLSRVALAAAALDGKAALAMARAGVADQALQRVASGAAAQACHQAALARAADQDGAHRFALKLRLFAAGRWPLGVVGGQLFML